MTTTDWLLLTVLLASLVLGAWRGFVYEVMSVLGWVMAFFVAHWAAPGVAARLSMGTEAESVRYVVAFVLVFVAAVFAAGLLAWLVKKLVEAVGLRPADRALGAAFGLLRGMVLLLAVTVVVGMTPLAAKPWWRESAGASALTAMLKGLRPVLPAQFGKYLPV